MPAIQVQCLSISLLLLVWFANIYFVDPYIISRDPAYSRWPNKTIPFIFTPGHYSITEQNLILAAMSQISTDMSLCLTWVNLGPSGIPYPNLNFVIISRNGGPGVPSPVCYSYPGMITVQNGLGQHMSIQASCMGNVRQVMRILSYLLGLRPEHNKPNRNSYISVNTAAATTVAVNAGAFNILTNTAAILYNPNEFDYNSITMLDVLTYSAAGLPVLASLTSSQITNIGRLSARDCQALSFIYTCSVTCSDVYGAGGLPTQFTTAVTTASTTSTSSSTSTTSSTTTSYISALCSPNFVVDAAWNDYTTHKLYFVSNNLVYVVQNGQIVENGTPLTTDFPGQTFSLPLVAGYYQSGTTFLIDQTKNTYLYINNAFVSVTTGSPTNLIAATGYGDVITAAQNPALVSTIYVDSSNDISSIGLNPSVTPKALATLFSSNATLVTDLSQYSIEEMYSVIDASGVEKIAFLYQPTSGALKYFDAVPCSTTTLLDTSSQVCLTLSTSPRNFASTIAACNVLPFT